MMTMIAPGGTDGYEAPAAIRAWLVLNVGGGYSLDTGGPHGESGFHLFLGLPFFLPGRSFYIEPYYRVLYATSDALNEVGLLVKWTSWNGD